MSAQEELLSSTWNEYSTNKLINVTK